MNVSRLTSRYPQRDDLRNPAIKTTASARTGGTRTPYRVPGTRPAIRARWRPRQSSRSGCRSMGHSAGLPGGRRQADGNPAARSHPNVGMGCGDRVTEGYDDEGDGEGNPHGQPDQTGQHSPPFGASWHPRIRRYMTRSSTTTSTSRTVAPAHPRRARQPLGAGSSSVEPLRSTMGRSTSSRSA